MFRQSITRLLGLVLLITTLLAGSEFGFAARKPIPGRKTTDAAGRISDAQRRAAAQQRRTVRDHFMRSIKSNGGRQ